MEIIYFQVNISIGGDIYDFTRIFITVTHWGVGIFYWGKGYWINREW